MHRFGFRFCRTCAFWQVRAAPYTNCVRVGCTAAVKSLCDLMEPPAVFSRNSPANKKQKILKKYKKPIDKPIIIGYTVVKLMIMIIITDKSTTKQSERR